jgi:hypothetical protein
MGGCLLVREITTYSVEIELCGRGVLRVHHRLKTHHVVLLTCCCVVCGVLFAV